MPINIDPENSARLNEYAAVTGKTFGEAVNEALDSWFETYGDIIVEELERRAGPKEGRLLKFPATKQP